MKLMLDAAENGSLNLEDWDVHSNRVLRSNFTGVEPQGHVVVRISITINQILDFVYLTKKGTDGLTITRLWCLNTRKCIIIIRIMLKEWKFGKDAVGKFYQCSYSLNLKMELLHFTHFNSYPYLLLIKVLFLFLYSLSG